MEVTYPKKYGVTFRYLADLVGKSQRTVEAYFYNSDWSINDIKNVREYLNLFLKD